MEDISEAYIPVVYQLPTIENEEQDIMTYDPTPKFSNTVAYPEFSLGFQHFIHQTKDKMEKTLQFEGKKRVYYIISQFERYVDDYDQDIGHISQEYFNLGDQKPDILSRAFYKLWELFFMFDLINLEQKNFVSAHLAEGPGSFIQATMFYRDKFTKNLSKQDKYYAVTLHAEKQHVQPVQESFIDYYAQEKPVRFIMHQTYPRDVARLSSKKIMVIL